MAESQDNREVKSRVKEFILFKKERGMSQTKMANLIGKTRGYINGLAHERTSVGKQTLNNLLKIDPELNRDWLFFGKGKMYDRNYSEQIIKENITEPDLLFNSDQQNQLLENAKKAVEEIVKYRQKIRECEERCRLLEKDNKSLKKQLVELTQGKKF
jgi:transcriptional regulator with XRE-family HTH domain